MVLIKEEIANEIFHIQNNKHAISFFNMHKMAKIHIFLPNKAEY